MVGLMTASRMTMVVMTFFRKCVVLSPRWPGTEMQSTAGYDRFQQDEDPFLMITESVLIVLAMLGW